MISIAPVIYSIRGGPTHNKYGDPYEWVVSGMALEDEIYLYGMAGKFDVTSMRQLRVLFRNMGFSKVSWERKRRSSVKSVIVEI